MNIYLLFAVFLFFFVSILAVIRLWLNKLEEKTRLSEELVEWLKSSTSSVDQKLYQQTQQINQRLDSATKVVGELREKMGQFTEIGRSMQELQEFLQSPKLRGNIGEQVLKELLSQYFPKDTYKLQYSFKNGEKVDAVIKTSQGMIPIDSKFPMENFRKLIKENNIELKEKFRKDFANDVKKHILDIAKKYILVEEGTADYALMYIPAESVYYEIINNTDLFDFSGQKRVLPVSPMSFYAYMKAILMSYEGQRIQSQAKQILEILQAIKKDYEKSEDALSTLQRHITNSYNQMATVTKNFLSLGQKLSSTNLLSDKKENEKLIE